MHFNGGEHQVVLTSDGTALLICHSCADMDINGGEHQVVLTSDGTVLLCL